MKALRFFRSGSLAEPIATGRAGRNLAVIGARWGWNERT